MVLVTSSVHRTSHWVMWVEATKRQLGTWRHSPWAQPDNTQQHLSPCVLMAKGRQGSSWEKVSFQLDFKGHELQDWQKAWGR